MNKLTATAWLVLLTACGGSPPVLATSAAPEGLRKLDAAGKPIQSPLNYILTRQEAYVPIGPDSSDLVTHELSGTRWVLVRLGETSVSVRDGGREPFIALESTSARVVGYAGCNRISGGYELNAEQLRFSQIAATRMACEDMQIEAGLLKALEDAAGWRIEGSQLILTDAGGASIAQFEARNL